MNSMLANSVEEIFAQKRPINFSISYSVKGKIVPKQRLGEYIYSSVKTFRNTLDTLQVH